MLEIRYSDNKIEAGCDEAGRGCLAGPVYAAAVILPADYSNVMLNDSKQLNERQRDNLRAEIERDAVAWAVASVNNVEIDHMNILRASFHAMNMAVAQLSLKPELLLIDGNRFYNESDIPFVCIVKGDAKYQSIAAASILAKTHRDEFMKKQHLLHPEYGWDSNKGYPTPKHYAAIEKYGITELHRKSYKLDRQTELEF
ncbi:MAG: ribonuclease HII [Bacteroidales bacterium]|nr:ribonuclease HII [Bacteroidales bacterium]MBP5516997.1 ribonuclease HII [Bacteroidales bacterium]